MQSFRILILCLAVSLTSCRYGKIMSNADPETETAVDTLEGPRELTTEGAELGEFEVKIEEEDQLFNLTHVEKVERNIPYTKKNNLQQSLDIYCPSKGEKPYKPIVVLNGGNFRKGSAGAVAMKKIIKATRFGYAVVLVDYRESENEPAPLHDAKAAIRFLRANSDELDLDAEEVVVWGISGGAPLAQLLGATNSKEEFEDPERGNSTASSNVQGVVSWNGFLKDEIEDPDSFRKKEGAAGLDPVELVTQDFPPILLVHAVDNELVPFSQSEEMQQRVNEVTKRRTARLVPYQKSGEGEEFSGEEKGFQESFDFLDKILFDGNNPYRKKVSEKPIEE